MNNSLQEKDYYLVYNDYYNFDYSKELNVLYLPLIGANAIKIYEFLATKLLNDKNMTVNSIHYELIDMLGINIKQFVLIRKKLEALGLLQTYYFEKDNKKFYIYKILRPLNFYEFLNNTLLSELLQNAIGYEAYTLIKDRFSLNKVSFENFLDITAKFSEVYSDEEVEYNINKNSKISYGPNLDQYYFDFSKLNYLLSNKYLDVILEDNSIKKDILNLAHLYKVSPENMADAIEHSIEDITSGTSINIEVLKDYLNQLFVTVKKQKPPVLDNMINKHLLADTYNLERELDEKEKFAKLLDNINYIEFLNRKWGLIISEIDSKNIIFKLQDKYNLTSGVLNVLLDYALSESNSKGLPSFNYFDKIASSWSSTKMVSALDAINFVNSQRDNYNKNKFNRTKSKNYNNPGNFSKSHIVQTPDYIKEQLNSLSNDTKLETNNDSISHDEFEKFLKEKGIN
ncbi:MULTISPECIES: DnaD domain protein [unclassified Gemella]|uniref:DnaD domain protein n=1 Tax=unclassified Gemella TaxID=2624949 RepID=UPI001C042535|nr:MULTISPECIES: DnaD domain protein [unclassified Gemella]MBU0278791.1 DnaD domain protein [Gemella sp. zg-1178]QWQ39341.1 DnaD domain protein [Gemella sp. zg-570]